MNQKDMIEKTAAYVKSVLGGEASGHDWWHVYRVWKTASQIVKREGGVDVLVVELAALLHDIADHKFHDGDLEIGSRKAKEWLNSLDCDAGVVEHVAKIISEISFKGAKVPTPMSTKEGAVVQDADRLDAIGAIGIARVFAYGGHKGNQMYDPAVKAEKHDSFESYRTNSNSSVNHFYEKLLLLKDRMNTKTGKAIAEERHEYMKGYLKRFFHEWEGC